MQTPMCDQHVPARAAIALLSVDTVDTAVSRAKLAVLERLSKSVHRYHYIPIIRDRRARFPADQVPNSNIQAPNNPTISNDPNNYAFNLRILKIVNCLNIGIWRLEFPDPCPLSSILGGGTL